MKKRLLQRIGKLLCRIGIHNWQPGTVNSMMTPCADRCKRCKVVRVFELWGYSYYYNVPDAEEVELTRQANEQTKIITGRDAVTDDVFLDAAIELHSRGQVQEQEFAKIKKAIESND